MELKDIQSMLTIDKHALDEALMVQAHILDVIGQRITLREAALDMKNEMLRRFEAKVFVQHKAAGDSDKVSAEKAKIHPDRDGLVEIAQTAEQELKEWRSVYEAWKQRGYALKELVALYSVDYYALTPAGSAKPRRDVVSESKRRRMVAP